MAQPNPKSETPSGTWDRPTKPPDHFNDEKGALLERLPEMAAADVAELVARAKLGFTIRGDRPKSGKTLDEAWAEVEKIKAMDEDTYASSRYRHVSKDIAIVGTLTALWPVMATVAPTHSPKKHAEQFQKDGKLESLEMFLHRVLRIDEGPTPE